MKTIAEIESQIKELLIEVEALKLKEPKFEVGKWYKDSVNKIFRFTHIDGIQAYGKLTSGALYSEHKNHIIPATHSEVESALIAEAKKRYKIGDKVKSIRYNSKSKELVFKEIEYYENHYSVKDVLYIDGYDVYESGKWAEIIKEDKIEIGGYEVKFESKRVTIDGHSFYKSFWQAAQLISEHSKAKIMVGCSKQFDVSLETINKILNKL